MEMRAAAITLKCRLTGDGREDLEHSKAVFCTYRSISWVRESGFYSLKLNDSQQRDASVPPSYVSIWNLFCKAGVHLFFFQRVTQTSQHLLNQPLCKLIYD
jgi:hypothetical protein